LNQRFLSWVALSILFAVCALAQKTSATLQGTVKDATGSVIPAARISITKIDTGVKSSTASNNDGYFTFPPVAIGRYLVHCEHPGMKAWEQDVELQTGQTTEINPVLALGQVTETVMVSSTIPLVTTTDPTDATTLDAQRLKELPINGRDLNTLLAEVAPGLEQDIGVNGGVRANGLLGYATDYQQDGAAANNRETGGSTGLQGLESIGEVRVETSTGNAKSSSPTSIIISTRGGTNRFRTSLYETIRNNAWGVAKHRQDVNPNGSPYKLPQLIRNEYGGSFGGPVMLPTFGLNGRKFYDGHNRTFFRVTREQNSLRQGLSRDYSVPTADMRNGIFTGLATNLGQPITLYDPLTSSVETINNRPITLRTPFVNNVLPVSRMSPLAKYIYNITPLPTDITAPNITTNLRFAYATGSLYNVNENPTTIKVDHRISDHDNLSAKTSWGVRNTFFQGNASPGMPTANREANVTSVAFTTYAAAFSETHIFSPGFFVENLLNRTWQISQTINGPFNDQHDWSHILGLPNPTGQIGWPGILNVGPNFATYTEGDNRRFLGSTITSAQQNYSWIKNTHTVQFGWAYHDEVQRLQPDQGNISGTTNFNSLSTALESSTTGSTSAPAVVTNTGFDAANFFLGYAANYNVYLSRGVMKVSQKTWAGYLQDNYKVTSRLTLTPGLRWDINPAINDEHHMLNTFDLKNHAILIQEPLDYYYRNGGTTPQVVANFQKVNVKFESARELNQSTQFFPNNYFDFGPRMGFAYRVLDGKKAFVIRGGYGLYVAAIAMRTLLAPFSSMAPFKSSFAYNPNAAAQSPDGNASYLLTHAPQFIAGLNSSNAVDINSPVALGVGQSVIGLGSNYPSAKVHQWNLMIEKTIGSATVLRLRYDGKHGANLDQTNEINPQASDYIYYTLNGTALPGGTFASVARRPYDQTAYSSVRVLEKTGLSNSNLGAIELERRFSRGLQFQVFYTMTNAFRLAGNSTRDGLGTTADQFFPGSVPKDFTALNRFLNYTRDSGVPKHRVRWNWIYELPVGQGHRLAGGAPKWLNTMIKGWALTGSGTVVSTWFALDTTNWNVTGTPEVYGKKYPILDCTGTPATAKTSADARCNPGYLYWNGYLSPRLINSVNAAGIPNGYVGIPASYKPAVTPLIPYGAPGQLASDYDTNVVYITLMNGTRQRVAFDNGLHPWRNQLYLGPFNWNMDSSLRKTFRIRESTTLQVSFDVFNVFNLQGTNPPGANGISSLQTSYGGFGFQPRQAQAGFRLEF